MTRDAISECVDIIPTRNTLVRSSGHVPELDLIRLLAALAVLVFHYKSKYVAAVGSDSVIGAATYAVTKFGYLGVDLFFLTSGFVIFSSAIGRDLRGFVISRITRIYPTFWICMTLTALVAIALRENKTPVTVVQWLANLTLLQKYLHIDAVDGVYWTLLVEMKFYACIAILIALRWLPNYRAWLTIWLLFTVTFRVFGQPFFMGVLISPEYSPYFIAGICFFLIRREGAKPYFLAVLVICLFLCMSFAYNTISTFTHLVSDKDRQIAAALVAGVFALFAAVSFRLVPLRQSVWLSRAGGMTFSIYLLHNMAGKDIYDSIYPAMRSLPLLVSIASLVFVSAYFIHIYVERILSDQLKHWMLRKFSSGRVTY